MCHKVQAILPPFLLVSTSEKKVEDILESILCGVYSQAR